MQKPSIGIIGGSGLYKIDGMTDIEKISIDTPFGKPSDQYTIGKLNGQSIAFLARHGGGHTLTPTELNYRANIYGFKKLGVSRIIAVSAVGSLKEEIAPTDIVIPHQFFDRTSKRVCTFFGNGIVGHIMFDKPICMDLAEILFNSAKKMDTKVHWGGTYLNMEGPQFSTRAESDIYRQWRMDIIGMTNLCEAKLSREAEICYSTLALVTDYDCWHPEHDTVTVEMVMSYLNKNVSTAHQILKDVINNIPAQRKCTCQHALKDSIVTKKELIPEKTKKNLDIILNKYF